ncbi:MAG: MGMT family protein [Clostridia bacterium]|nr:MGMT family protein [Clostridia bacterium]
MAEDMAQAVRALAAQIPPGKVASYGQLALMSGHPRGARMVGYIMRGKASRGLPCHRVIRQDGSLCPPDIFGGPGIQRAMLEAEGVVFLPDGRVDMAQCRWQGP